MKPDTTLEQFAEDLHQEVLSKSVGTDLAAGANGGLQLREEMFTEAVLELLADHDEVSGWELCAYEAPGSGRTPAAKLNAWALCSDGATLDLFVTLYHGTGAVEEVGKPQMRRHFDLALGFLKRALVGFHSRMEEASDAFHAAQSIHSTRDSIATVRLFFLSDGVVRSLDIEPETLPGLEVRYIAWDLEKLSRLRVGDRGTIALDFERDYGGPLPCLEFAAEGSDYRTFLACVPAPVLARVYGEYGQRLLERNVRAFLQTKSKINRGIQITLRDEPQRFLAYNNGLCCTAAEVRVHSNGDGSARLSWAGDFQIVNGGQTTASIFHAQRKEGLDLSTVAVQMKLTVISDPERVAEIVPMISRYANSQNKVNGADFAANGKFHRDLEEQSRTVWAPAASGLERGDHWYYERARGSYLDDKGRQPTPSRIKEWQKQNPPGKKFTKTDLAKFEHAWLGLPHVVCRGAEKNFAAFAARLEDDGEPAVDRRFFEQVVARAILWRSAETLFLTLNLTGYRANSIAYAIAWLAERSGRRLDLERIWREQCLSEAVSKALLVACREAHRFLTSQPGNVGEASKKLETWSTFRALDLDMPGEWREETSELPIQPYLPSRSSQQVEQLRTKLVDVPAERWFALSKWAKERGFLEGWERSLAYSLGTLAARKAVPSDKQTIQGSRILERARELGFPVQD
ncbi:MAG: AIPR family protein [Thermoanaerobaculia bacterium]